MEQNNRKKSCRYLAAALALALGTGFGLSGVCTAGSAPLASEIAGAVRPPEPPQGKGLPPEAVRNQQNAAKLTAKAITDQETKAFDNQTLTASATNESAFLARNGATVTLTNSTLNKTGDSSDTDASNFSGQNAVFLSSNSTATLSHLTLNSDADGANAIFSTGDKSIVNVSHVVIHTKNNSSRGLDATYGGTIHAKDVEITTEGAHCGALATDRGEGNVLVENAKIVTSGEGSPCIYSTGNIQLTNGTGEAMGSEIAVVEGKNSIVLNNARLTGHVKHGIMLYQSFSGDAGIGEAKFTAKNSILTNKSNGPMFYITNTTATANLENTQLIQDGDVLILAASDRWGKEGRNGGIFTLNATQQELAGKVLGNNISQITLNLQSGSHWTGSFNEDYAADKASLNLAQDAVWDVTANSYLTTFSDADSTFHNINSNGHKIYYDKKENPALGGKTYKLPGGGKLIAK